MNRSLKTFSVKLGGATGMTPYKTKIERRLSHLREDFMDKNLVEKMLLTGENPLIYDVYDIPQQPTEGMFNVGCTVVFPGKIGDEYYLTRGHFHQKEPTSEVYIGFGGEGIILMQDREGKTVHVEVEPNVLVYIPPNTAHRSVNTGKSELVILAIYPSEAGHDYGAIEAKGFAKIVVERKGRPAIIDNPYYEK